MITEYYTGTNYRPVKSIAEASVTGHGTNVIQGLAVSLESTALPALVIVAGIIVDLHARGPVRHRHRGHGDAGAGRLHRGPRRLRAGHRQRRRHRRDGGPAQGGAQVDRRARRGRQHHQGRDQGLRHRLGRPRRPGAVRGLHLGPELLHPEANAAARPLPYFQGVTSTSRCPTPTSSSACCSAASSPSSSAASP